MKRSRTAAPVLQPRLRILCGGEIALGPGKAELLGHTAETGSISKAAALMGMSYMRAWTLRQTMNTRFREPVMAATRGGSERRGACLTASGRAALALYQRMEKESRAAAATTWSQLQGLFKS